MTDLPTPTASRLRAPSWRDARLLVGVLLVLVSTVAGAVVVARADDRVPVYAAKEQVAPGQRLTEADLVRVDVLLGDGAAAYLPADRPVLSPPGPSSTSTSTVRRRGRRWAFPRMSGPSGFSKRCPS